MNAILYIMRTGALWHYLSKEYRPWRNIYTRYSRWTKVSIWKKAHTKPVRSARAWHGRGNRR
ncbi:MAG: transposase [Desulfocurvibacter africanus]